MIDNELIEKYNNHRQKAAVYDTELFMQLYDKYLSVYTCYNMLFSEIPAVLKARGEAITMQENETNKATLILEQYLTAQTIWQTLQANGLEKNITALKDVMEGDYFNIKLNHEGKPQKNQDALLLDGLKSELPAEKVKSVLKMIYYVRCNMSHGSKDIAEYQRFLLEPLLNIMIAICDRLFSRLTAQA